MNEVLQGLEDCSSEKNISPRSWTDLGPTKCEWSEKISESVECSTGMEWGMVEWNSGMTLSTLVNNLGGGGGDVSFTQDFPSNGSPRLPISTSKQCLLPAI